MLFILPLRNLTKTKKTMLTVVNVHTISNVKGLMVCKVHSTAEGVLCNVVIMFQTVHPLCQFILKHA